MPFEMPLPWPFTPSAIREHAPVQPGGFGLSKAGEWIFIGETENIQATLLLLIGDRNNAVQRRQPTGFVYEVCERDAQSKRQDRLILEYEPTCNRHWSRHK